MHVVRVLRCYLGLSQSGVAQLAGLHSGDISEIETKDAFGWPSKFQRLSNALGISVEAIVKNDFTAISESFFDRWPEPEYIPVPAGEDHELGRAGEEYILKRERERLAKRWPALARLVLPLFKMRKKKRFPGYDILSFDDFGQPILLEVKTSRNDDKSFNLTRNEVESAEEYLKEGERVFVVSITGWGTNHQEVQDVSYEELVSEFCIQPVHYHCRRKVKREKTFVSGLALHRERQDMTQGEAAECLGINSYELSLYENRKRNPMIEIYKAASILYDTTIDELMMNFDSVTGETYSVVFSEGKEDEQ